MLRSKLPLGVTGSFHNPELRVPPPWLFQGLDSQQTVQYFSVRFSPLLCPFRLSLHRSHFAGGVTRVNATSIPATTRRRRRCRIGWRRFLCSCRGRRDRKSVV